MLYQRKPIPAPIKAPANTISSPERGKKGTYKYSAIIWFPIAYATNPNPPVIKIEGKIAKPSRPSVKLTALDEPTITNIPNKIKNTIEISKIKSFLDKILIPNDNLSKYLLLFMSDDGLFFIAYRSSPVSALNIKSVNLLSTLCSNIPEPDHL